MNGIHLILKEREESLSINQTQFKTSTFIVQIHGFPPMYMHEGTTRLVGSKIGKIHNSSLNRKCVVAQRYLKLRMDINIENPIPAGFFFGKREGYEVWIQFKYKILLDYCYTCGMLNHVVGRCFISS